MTNGWRMVAVALALTGVAGQAQATERCWSPVEEAAAKVRGLQTRLMDATFKCQLVGADITARYNRFIGAGRATLQGATGVLRARLGEQGYDRFVTDLANEAGGRTIDSALCVAAGELADAASLAGDSAQALVTLAEQNGVAPALAEGGCPLTFAVVAASVSAAPLVD